MQLLCFGFRKIKSLMIMLLKSGFQLNSSFIMLQFFLTRRLLLLDFGFTQRWRYYGTSVPVLFITIFIFVFIDNKFVLAQNNSLDAKKDLNVFQLFFIKKYLSSQQAVEKPPTYLLKFIPDIIKGFLSESYSINKPLDEKTISNLRQKYILFLTVNKGATLAVFNRPLVFPYLKFVDLNTTLELNIKFSTLLKQNYPNLRGLTISQNEKITDDELTLINNFSKLRELTLNCHINNLSSINVQNLNYLSLCDSVNLLNAGRLKQLQLNNCYISKEYLQKLKAPRLNNLSFNSTNFEKESMKEFFVFKKLKHLDFTNCLINNEDISYLNALRLFENIDVNCDQFYQMKKYIQFLTPIQYSDGKLTILSGTKLPIETGISFQCKILKKLPFDKFNQPAWLVQPEYILNNCQKLNLPLIKLFSPRVKDGGVNLKLNCDYNVFAVDFENILSPGINKTPKLFVWNGSTDQLNDK